jgi:hypothetical protein
MPTKPDHHDYKKLAKELVETMHLSPAPDMQRDNIFYFNTQLLIMGLVDYESSSYFVVRRRESGEKVFCGLHRDEMRFANVEFARAVRDAYIAKFPAAKLEILQVAE